MFSALFHHFWVLGRGGPGRGFLRDWYTSRLFNLLPWANVNCKRQPADKGPLARGAATHIEHCVRSIYSSSGAASLATLVVPHSAMSVGAAWNRVATNVWWPVVETREWNCGPQCAMWGVLFVCLFVLQPYIGRCCCATHKAGPQWGPREGMGYATGCQPWGQGQIANIPTCWPFLILSPC